MKKVNYLQNAESKTHFLFEKMSQNLHSDPFFEHLSNRFIQYCFLIVFQEMIYNQDDYPNFYEHHVDNHSYKQNCIDKTFHHIKKIFSEDGRYFTAKIHDYETVFPDLIDYLIRYRIELPSLNYYVGLPNNLVKKFIGIALEGKL